MGVAAGTAESVLATYFRDLGASSIAQQPTISMSTSSRLKLSALVEIAIHATDWRVQ